jgi:putative transposase
MTRQRSYTANLIHLVWATRHRVPLIPQSQDAWLAAQLRAEACALRCGLLAVGGGADHVHALVQLWPTTNLSDLAQQLKGGSAHAWNERRDGLLRLAWQKGYWAESVSPAGRDGLCRYIRDQRKRHAYAKVPEAWESLLHLD